MSESTSSASSGIGLGGAVFIVFLILKLIGIEPVASWSWWWVTSPLWGIFALAFAAFAVFLVVKFVVMVVISPIVDAVNRRSRLKTFDDS